MTEDDFYSTIKLKNGEEIFAKVAVSEEDDKILLIVFNPIIITEIKGRLGLEGYKIEPWLKTTTDDLFVVNLDDVLTMSESNDIEMISMYQTFVRQSQKTSASGNKAKLSKEMGYLANVRDAKEILEKLYKNS